MDSDQKGVLTLWLREHPYSVVIFDEIEKAHAKVQQLLLSLFEDGRIPDAHGVPAYGREAVFILTSNVAIPPETYEQAASSGAWDELESDYRLLLCQHLRPELVNRLDRVIAFAPLGDEEQVRLVLKVKIDQLELQLLEIGVTLSIPEDTREAMALEAAKEPGGARAVERYLQRTLRRRISEWELRGKLVPGSEVQVRLVDGMVRVSAQPPQEGTSHA